MMDFPYVKATDPELYEAMQKELGRYAVVARNHATQNPTREHSKRECNHGKEQTYRRRIVVVLPRVNLFVNPEVNRTGLVLSVGQKQDRTGGVENARNAPYHGCNYRRPNDGKNNHEHLVVQFRTVDFTRLNGGLVDLAHCAGNDEKVRTEPEEHTVK